MHRLEKFINRNILLMSEEYLTDKCCCLTCLKLDAFFPHTVSINSSIFYCSPYNSGASPDYSPSSPQYRYVLISSQFSSKKLS